MGTDIHLHVEMREPGAQYWTNIDDKLPDRACSWCSGTGTGNDKRCHRCLGRGKVHSPWDDRNYDAFAMLADVRNGSGFAGTDSGDGFKPIAEPRGLPDRIDFETEEDTGDHSKSWVTLAELLAYDFSRVTKQRGVTPSWAYKLWRDGGKKGCPSYYCGDVYADDVVKVSNNHLDRLLLSGAANATAPDGKCAIEAVGRDGKRYYTVCEWTETYAEAAGSLLDFIESLKSLGLPPEDVRLVFGFDS